MKVQSECLILLQRSSSSVRHTPSQAHLDPLTAAVEWQVSCSCQLISSSWVTQLHHSLIIMLLPSFQTCFLSAFISHHPCRRDLQTSVPLCGLRVLWCWPTFPSTTDIVHKTCESKHSNHPAGCWESTSLCVWYPCTKERLHTGGVRGGGAVRALQYLNFNHDP